MDELTSSRTSWRCGRTRRLVVLLADGESGLARAVAYIHEDRAHIFDTQIVVLRHAHGAERDGPSRGRTPTAFGLSSRPPRRSCRTCRRNTARRRRRAASPQGCAGPVDPRTRPALAV